MEVLGFAFILNEDTVVSWEGASCKSLLKYLSVSAGLPWKRSRINIETVNLKYLQT